MHTGPLGDGADWAAVARAALQREPRPALILDGGGAVAFANQAVVSALGWMPSEIVGRAFAEFCVRPDRRGEVERRLAHATEDPLARQPVSLACRTSGGEPVTLVTELTAIGGPVPAYLLLLVLEINHERPIGPRLIGDETYYEISLASGRDFGALSQVWTQAGALPVGLGERCYQRLHNRPSQCADCPAVLIDPQRSDALAIRVQPEMSVGLEVVRARRVSSSTVGVSAFPVPEALLSLLLQRKISVLATRGGLSEREKSVLDLLLLGRTMENIASELQISSRTVKYHQRNIQRKLGAESRADLVRLLL